MGDPSISCNPTTCPVKQITEVQMENVRDEYTSVKTDLKDLRMELRGTREQLVRVETLVETTNTSVKTFIEDQKVIVDKVSKKLSSKDIALILTMLASIAAVAKLFIL